MIIKDIFAKDINRTIETVIKADDRDNIADEVVEYVITDEIAQKVRDFFEEYLNFTNANGVWISGYFGCGKSHLLKILSYVLENKEFDGYHSGELFAEKIEDDEMFRGDVKAAVNIPSESVLFNIDQQAQITSKTDPNAILSVFYKVFYDHLGYYGFQPHVAEFEMWLDKQGQYETFKTQFQSKFDRDWYDARKDYFDPAVEDTIAEVLAELNDSSEDKYLDILSEMEEKNKQSIEDFCLKVKSYIDSKESKFRLNFFVDEVGQYISDNTKLMLNLQTIAETLATKTKGRSWIFVTSQEDMENLIGDMNKRQQNDFSRIQARFRIKIPLTSANVDEVIEKRLLKKDDTAINPLKELYKTEHRHMETLLSFSDVGVAFRGFQDEQDFSNKYPFIPYQFDLFQNCRRALSSHNAFQGKHSSVGERSMLGVFQQVVQGIENQDESTIVSFDMMYKGIKNELRGEIQSTIILAEKNIDDQFTINLLKMLFMVKYFQNFKTTKRNISVLMIDNLHIDLSKHEDKVDKALTLLENQNYIQRNGDIYEFLTEAEKDIEQEIKDTDIDDQAVTQELKKIFFDEIIKESKIPYHENSQYYSFTSKIDGVTVGREKELEIEIITENYVEYNNIAFLKSQTMGASGMKMVLPVDDLFIKDLRLFLKTQKYVKQNQSVSNNPDIKRILHEKAIQNNDRKRDLTILGDKLLAKSTVYLNGGQHEMPQTNQGKDRVIKAFQDLVKIVYPNLKMLGNVKYSEDMIRSIIKERQDDLFKTDDTTLEEAETEVLTLIKRRKSQSDRTSLKDAKEYFARKPYGWYENAVWCIIAKLYKRSKLDLKQDSNILEDDQVINALINSKYHGNTLLEVQEKIDPRLVKNLKEVYADAFDESISAKDPKDVARGFADGLKKMQVEVNQLLVRKGEYPFLGSLLPFSEQLDKLVGKEYNYYLKNLDDFENDLIDFKEDILVPVKRFMNSDQVKIYDRVKQFLNSDTSNLDYVEGDEMDILKELMESATPFKNNLTRDAKTAIEKLNQKVSEKLESERENAVSTIKEMLSKIKYLPNFGKLDTASKDIVNAPFEKEIKKIEANNYIASIRDISNHAKTNLYKQQLNKIDQLLQPPTGSNEVPPNYEYISYSEVKPQYSKSILQAEEDVDEYIEALRKALKDQIKNNKRISL